MDGMPEKLDSKFRFVLVAATRAEQLMRGARPKVENVPGKPTVKAMAELQTDMIEWEYGPAPVQEVEEVVEVPEVTEEETS